MKRKTRRPKDISLRKTQWVDFYGTVMTALTAAIAQGQVRSLAATPAYKLSEGMNKSVEMSRVVTAAFDEIAYIQKTAPHRRFVATGRYTNKARG